MVDVTHNNGVEYTYKFHLKDHLGNIRAVFSPGMSTPAQLNDYYPFGMISKTSTNGNTSNKYLYNGKELQDELDVDWYDYGARFYDPQIGRWMSVDPLSETTSGITPYHYCYNNPIHYNDPSGMIAEWGWKPTVDASTHVDEDGFVIAVFNDGDLGVYKHKGKGAEARAEVDKSYSKTNTSAGGEYVGETYYWDEFLQEAHGNNGNNGNNAEYIIPGARIDFYGTWDGLVEELHEETLDMNYYRFGNKSRGGKTFDLKSNSNWAPFGVGTGKKLGGKFVSARSAGNYLAGLNASGRGRTFAEYMKIAGALHASGKSDYPNTLFGAAVLTGSAYGYWPWFGENNYCGRMVVRGWLDNKNANDVAVVKIIFDNYCK